MLVLTRHTAESVVIRDKEGKEIGKVVICGIRGKQVKIGFEFERDFMILRSELLEGSKNADLPQKESRDS